METRTQNGSGSTGLLHILRDSGRQQVGEPDPREAFSQQTHVLSLDQIRIIRSSNEYTEGPTVAPRPPASQHPQKAEQELEQLEEQRLAQRSPPPQHPTQALSRSSSAVSQGSRSSARTSTGSNTSSEQRLLGNPVAERIIRAQPNRSELKAEELKPLPSAENGAGEGLAKHAYRCEDCGLCKCKECTRPRALPSCWVCGGRCACSAENVVDYGTCVCCVKGLFYHCSSDDEDVCADNPFSCTQSHCCVRWSAMGIMSLFLPCLLCYLPTKGCLKLCQGCYDRVKRPGCRCRNTNVVHCKTVNKPT